MKEKGEKESIHADHRQRMRERIAHGGIEGLSDHEVLEYLLYPFIPRKDTNVIAHELIERFSSLDGVAHATPAMLRQIKGITENAVLFLSCMTDIGDRCRESRAFSV